MNQSADIIRQNYLRTRERVLESASQANRSPDEITIVGVAKYVDVETTRMLFEAGCVNLGESRPQALEQKATALHPLPICWHMIGHLQRNKVARTLNHASLIHSVDSQRVLEAIDRLAGDRAADSHDEFAKVGVLLEVNVSGDEAKHGFRPDELLTLIQKFAQLKNVDLRGLMCMAGLTSSDSETQKQFASLRELREQIQAQLPPEHRFSELSMGMSRDFQLAIAEGATLVRIGSVLFEGVL